MDQSPQKNPGTPLSMAALIMGILALLGSPVIFFISTGWASFEDGTVGALGLAIGWSFLSSTAVLLGILGRKKSKASGHKAGLGVAAMVIGLVAELLCIGIIYAVFVAGGVA
ncbi:MAG: hypothetical protein M3R17_07645 [Bacteroidota bacterium]|nr:hypothetical protein [Bacteroidota bacterium]